MGLNSRTILVLLAATFAIQRVGSSEDPPARVAELQPPFTPAEFQSHVVYLASDELKGRLPGTDGWAKAAAYIIEHLQECGLRPLNDDGSWFQEFRLNLANLPNGTTTAKNILAVLDGRGELKDQAVIISAHYDHLGSQPPQKDGEDTIYNGADDNASGVSAMLLIAKVLSMEQATLPPSRRTVVFIGFDAEERGLLGSHHYVRNPVWPLDRTAAIINFDAMGRLRMGKFYASDAETNPILARAVNEAAKSRGLVAETRFGGHGRSDHAVFLERGIPGMHFFTGANSDYHQVSDHWDRLNLEGGASIAWIGWQVLRTAMTHPDRFEYQKLNPVFDMQFVLNMVRTMGIIPALNAQEGRYPQILFVVPNTPAAKYGLQGGDQLTAINGIGFKRVEDALTVFQQLTFDEGLRMSILRGGKETEVTIPASFFEEMSGPKATRLETGMYQVTFRFHAPGAKDVYLAGDFNNWQPTAHRMDGPDGSGMFSTRLELKPGVYEYKFVIEGKDWKSDPKNLYQVGRQANSVLWAGTERN